MKTYTVTLEVDDNVTLEDLQLAITEMADNTLNTTECFYSIEENNI